MIPKRRTPNPAVPASPETVAQGAPDVHHTALDHIFTLATGRTVAFTIVDGIGRVDEFPDRYSLDDACGHCETLFKRYVVAYETFAREFTTPAPAIVAPPEPTS